MIFKADWITHKTGEYKSANEKYGNPSPYFRKCFHITKSVKKAYRRGEPVCSPTERRLCGMDKSIPYNDSLRFQKIIFSKFKHISQQKIFYDKLQKNYCIFKTLVL